MKKGVFLEKTYDVKCDKRLLSLLNADWFLYVKGFDILDYLTCDIEILQRRSSVFYDTTHIPGLASVLEAAIGQLEHIAQIIRLQSSVDTVERSLYSCKQLELYFEVIDMLYDYLLQDNRNFTSEDYAELFDRILKIAESAEYRKLKNGISTLLEQISQVKSISIGFNFDASLSPSEAGILSVNNSYVQSGLLIDRILRFGDTKSNKSAPLSMAPLVAPQKVCSEKEYDVLNYSLYSALNKTFKKQIKQWEPEICEYMSSKLSFLIDILPDLKFILSIEGIQSRMKKLNLTLCAPKLKNKEEKCFRAEGIYNPVLAVKALEQGGGHVVKNDFEFDDAAGIYILTGPNNGGKSVFLSAICLTQIMAQLGMLVPASSLEISPCSSILAEFPKYDSLNQKGRLADECEVIRDMFNKIDEFSLCVFDETFSSTSEEGATALSTEILMSLSFLGARGIYSTHLHGLARKIEEINSLNTSKSKLDSLVAEINSNEERTYKFFRIPPQGNSHSVSIARKYGITFDILTKY